MTENKNLLTIPSLAASTTVIAFFGVLTAVVTFVWVFTSEANELRIANQETKFDQINLREYAKEIAETVRLNTIAINENTMAIKANGEQIKEIAETVRLNTIAINENTMAIKANGEQIKELRLKVDGIESDVKYIKCKIDNNFSENDCTELLDNQ